MSSIAEVPIRFMDRTLDGYQPTTPTASKALDAARRFASGDLTYLVLIGPTGVGKSHLAAGAAAARYEHDHRQHIDSPDHAAMLARREAAAPWEKVRECVTAARPFLWQNVADLIVGLREDMDKPMDDKSWGARVELMRVTQGVLVLDDLGREKVSDWTGETIYALVNRRYESLLPTIVTTNLTGAELAASPYWPVMSRLAENGALIRIDAPDRRLA